MKIFMFLIGVLFTSLSCSKKEINEDISIIEDVSIIGEWKLIERIGAPLPGPGGVSKVQNGRVIKFTENDTYIDPALECEASFYRSESKINISVPCRDEGFLYNIKKLNSKVMHVTTYPFTCDEGCVDVFSRVN